MQHHVNRFLSAWGRTKRFASGADKLLDMVFEAMKAEKPSIALRVLQRKKFVDLELKLQ